MGRRHDVQGDAGNSCLPWRECSPVEHLWGRSWEIPCGSSRASIFLTRTSQKGRQAAVMFSGRVWLLLSATSIFHPKLSHFKLKYVKIFQHFNQRENPCKGTGHRDPRGEDRRGSVLDPAFPMLWALERLGRHLSSSQIEIRGRTRSYQRWKSRHELSLPFLQTCYPKRETARHRPRQEGRKNLPRSHGASRSPSQSRSEVAFSFCVTLAGTLVQRTLPRRS